MSKKKLKQARGAIVSHLLATLGQRVPVIVHESQEVLGNTIESGQIGIKLDYLTLELHERESGFLPGMRSESSMHSI